MKEPFKFESKAKMIEWLKRLRYEVRENVKVKGASGARHTVEVLAKVDDGIFTHEVAFGIATADGKQIRVYTGMGRVSYVFTEETLRPLTGHIAIGHNRYSTAGSSRAINAQPIIVGNDGSTMGIAHNGNIVNAAHLYEELAALGYTFRGSTDSEVIANLILSSPGKSWVEKIKYAMRRLQGAYSLVIITPQELYAVRDPFGVRPLCLGTIDHGWVVASETCALDHIGASFVREIEPGEIIAIDANGVTSYPGEPGRRGLCIFEYIYFARPDSLINGRLLYPARQAMGAGLAREYPVDADLVETGKLLELVWPATYALPEPSTAIAVA
jgi:amidophosphoribosyltransferase